MTDSLVQHAGLPHAVFLHRMAGGVLPSAVEPRLGRAAFVALRLVDLLGSEHATLHPDAFRYQYVATLRCCRDLPPGSTETRSEEHTSELQSRLHLVCRLLLEKKKKNTTALSITPER